MQYCKKNKIPSSDFNTDDFTNAVNFIENHSYLEGTLVLEERKNPDWKSHYVWSVAYTFLNQPMITEQSYNNMVVILYTRMHEIISNTSVHKSWRIENNDVTEIIDKITKYTSCSYQDLIKSLYKHQVHMDRHKVSQHLFIHGSSSQWKQNMLYFISVSDLIPDSKRFYLHSRLSNSWVG